MGFELFMANLILSPSTYAVICALISFICARKIAAAENAKGAGVWNGFYYICVLFFVLFARAWSGGLRAIVQGRGGYADSGRLPKLILGIALWFVILGGLLPLQVWLRGKKRQEFSAKKLNLICAAVVLGVVVLYHLSGFPWYLIR